MITLFFR